MRILKILGILLGIVLILAVLFLWLWDFSRYEQDIEAAVSGATGREFRIDGAFDVEVLPSPTVLVERASLANAEWADSPEMVEVGHAYVKVGFWSLLFRPIVVHSLELTDVNVMLEANADGEANWDIGDEQAQDAEAAADEGSPESPVDLRSANISNIRVTYRQPEADDVEVVLDSLVVTTDADDIRSLEGGGRVADTPVGITGRIAEAHTDFEASYGDVRFMSSSDRPGDSVDFTATLGSLSDVGTLLDIQNLPVENLSLAGNLSMRGDSLVISGVVASIPGLRLTLDGELDGALGTAQLTIGAEGENLSVLGAQLPDIPFSATTELVGAEETLDFSPFAFTFGESEISGGLQVTGGDNPSINLTAASPLIDLRPFTSEEESEMESDEPPESEQGEYVFTEEPLPLDTLRDMRAEIDFTVDRLRLTSSDARNLKARATIEDGILNFENTFDGQRDGRFETGVQLAATGADEAELKITSKVRGLKTGILSGEGVPVDLIPATTIDIGLDAVGGTPRELASSLNGGVVVTQGPGRVRNDLIEKLSGDIVAQLFSALNPFARDEEFTDWDCTVFALDFDSGAGEITGFLLQSDKLMVVGGGGIDLNTEKLNIEFNTKPRAGVGISADMFVTPFVKLSGTLANPSVGLNAKGALLSGGAAVLTGGMSFLYQGLVDRATAEGGQCEQALESVRAPEANED